MKHSGFTLVELLAVIAIVAVLMAIMFPSLYSTRQQAKAVVCQSNIRELTVMLLSYETENQTFPFGFYRTSVSPCGGHLGNAVYDRPGWWWINYLYDYSKNDESKKTIFNCPSKNLNNSQINDLILYGNYGVNLSICKISSSRKAVWDEFKVKKQSGSGKFNLSRTLLIADSGYALIGWPHVNEESFDKLQWDHGEDTSYIPGLKINSQRVGVSFLPGQEEDAVKGRHPQKSVNVGFADGHLERRKANDLLVEKTESVYKNRSPLWCPE